MDLQDSQEVSESFDFDLLPLDKIPPFNLPPLDSNPLGDGVQTLAGWYGSNRMLARMVGETLGKCRWVGIPFCGGLCEVPHIRANVIVASDLHQHVINLARVVKKDGVRLYKDLRRLQFSQKELEDAQRWCLARLPLEGGDYDAAFNYFVCIWMSRGGSAGSVNEFKGKLSTRWRAGGGDSAVRYRSAANSLLFWMKELRRVTLLCVDFRDFLAHTKDASDSGLYVDAPWPEDGDLYLHKFTEDDHRELAVRLTRYTKTRVVIRFGDHPLIHDLYPKEIWERLTQTSRTQANKLKSEFLLTKRN